MARRVLSKVDLLPEEAGPAIRRAIDALKERDQPKEEIRKTLNLELAELKLKPISRSGFNRYSLQQQLAFDRHAKAVAVASAFADKAKELENGNVGAVTAAYLRDILFDVISVQMEDSEKVDIKALGQAAQALYRINRAELIAESGERETLKAKAEKEAAEKAATETVRVVREAGLPEDAINRLKAAMGIKVDGE